MWYRAWIPMMHGDLQFQLRGAGEEEWGQEEEGEDEGEDEG